MEKQNNTMRKDNIKNMEDTAPETSEMQDENKTSNVSKKQKKSKKTDIKKLQSEVERLQKENNDLKDQLLRKLAEFDNYTKRIEREYGELISQANGSMIHKLLPVIDDFERALNQQIDDNGKEDFRRGVELIFAKFFKILEDSGLKIMDSDGKEFNPEIHDAMIQLENKEVPSSHIVETFEKGYSLNEKIIRHAKVSVSK